MLWRPMDYKGSTLSPCVLNLNTRGMWVVSFILQPFYLCIKRLYHPLDRKLAGCQSWFSCGDKREIPAPTSTWTLVIQPVTFFYIEWAVCELKGYRHLLCMLSRNAFFMQHKRKAVFYLIVGCIAVLQVSVAWDENWR